MGKWGVGMPASLYLHEFGSQVWAAFGTPPYLVGSVLRTTKWRDVDVRLILDDEEYQAMGLGDPNYQQHNGKWVSLCMAYSALGHKMTGLPIDFQIQQQTWANKGFPKQPRSSLSVTPLRLARRDTNDETSVSKGQRSERRRAGSKRAKVRRPAR